MWQVFNKTQQIHQIKTCVRRIVPTHVGQH